MKPDPRIVYADIIDLPHHQSKTHPRMSLYNRAAQFAPFAALSGYDEMISEETRETGVQQQLEDWEMEKINQKLNLIDQDEQQKREQQGTCHPKQ